MRVRATQRGFHVRLQEAGDAFDVSPALFSSTWMEKVEQPAEPSTESQDASKSDRRAELEEMSVGDLRALVEAANGPSELAEAKGKSARGPIIDWLLAAEVKGDTDG